MQHGSVVVPGPARLELPEQGLQADPRAWAELGDALRGCRGDTLQPDTQLLSAAFSPAIGHDLARMKPVS
jgi:hypothetical protein